MKSSTPVKKIQKKESSRTVSRVGTKVRVGAGVASQAKPVTHASTLTKKAVPSLKKSTTTVSRPKSKSKKVLSNVGRSTKRYGKRALRGMLLSPIFHTAFKIFVGIAISGSALYGSYAYMGKTFANDIVVSKSEIVHRIAKLTTVPDGVPDEVVRVQDPDILKKQNAFYDRVKEGDYIVMYPKVAIIYDLRNNQIVAMKTTGE